MRVCRVARGRVSGAGAWLAHYGLTVPDDRTLVQGAIAFGLVMASLLVGWFAGVRLGPYLGDLWKRTVGIHAEGLHERLATIVRHAVAAMLLAIIARSWAWQPLPRLGLGVALGAATARLVVQLLRGVHLARWMAWTVAGLVFVGILSQSVGGLAPITDTLDGIGFDVGRRRISLLTGVTMLLTVVVLFAIVRVANRTVGHALAQTRGLDPTQRLLGQKLASIAFVIAAFFFGIDALGIDLTTFAVFGGAFGLAIGFGLQKTIGNLIAGIILLMDRSIKPGDVIAVGDSFGWVNKIGVRAVSVITRDGKEHLIPNEILMTQEVENWSYSDRNVRIRIPVSISYDCDVDLAQQLMLRAAVETPRVLDVPPPVVWMTDYGDYALQHEIRLWISDPEGGMGNVKGELLKRLWRLFKEHDIIVPVPQREVRIVRSMAVDAETGTS